MTDSREEIRQKLLDASEQLLSGEAVGPLTGVRLVELAGTKRHRLTHDNSDIAASFKRRASEVNRTKPEVDLLRAKLNDEKARNTKLVNDLASLRQRVELYASRLDELVDERDRLLEALATNSNVTSLRREP